MNFIYYLLGWFLKQFIAVKMALCNGETNTNLKLILFNSSYYFSHYLTPIECKVVSKLATSCLQFRYSLLESPYSVLAI